MKKSLSIVDFTTQIFPVKIYNSGTATWYRTFWNDGVTVGWDGSVGLKDCDMNMSKTDLKKGGAFTLGKFVYVQKKAKAK